MKAPLALATLAILFCTCALSAQPAPTPPASEHVKFLWMISKEMMNPESVHYVKGHGIFVSNTAGPYVANDNTAWINLLSEDGKLTKAKWFSTGLSAPKGVTDLNGMLCVDDLNVVLFIDIATAAIKQRVQIPDAKFLNDNVVGPDGAVYVSDTVAAKIYKIQNGQASVWVEGGGMDSPNGLFIKDGKMYVAGWGRETNAELVTTAPGRLYEIDMQSKQIHYITPEPLGHLDGIDIDSAGNFIVSDNKGGFIYRVTPDGKPTKILQDLVMPADIQIIPGTNTLLIPEWGASRVSAYELLQPSTR